MTSREAKVWTKMSKNQILFLVCKKVIFHYFWKWTKILLSTFQDLSIDILHVKIRPFLQILKKKLWKKCVFALFWPFFSKSLKMVWSFHAICLWKGLEMYFFAERSTFSLFFLSLRSEKLDLNWSNVCVIVYSIIT